MNLSEINFTCAVSSGYHAWDLLQNDSLALTEGMVSMNSLSLQVHRLDTIRIAWPFVTLFKCMLLLKNTLAMIQPRPCLSFLIGSFGWWFSFCWYLEFDTMYPNKLSRVFGLTPEIERSTTVLYRGTFLHGFVSVYYAKPSGVQKSFILVSS